VSFLSSFFLYEMKEKKLCESERTRMNNNQRSPKLHTQYASGRFAWDRKTKRKNNSKETKKRTNRFYW